jgi:hypothetical protein
MQDEARQRRPSSFDLTAFLEMVERSAQAAMASQCDRALRSIALL